jgi:hypothetical protein
MFPTKTLHVFQVAPPPPTLSTHPDPLIRHDLITIIALWEEHKCTCPICSTNAFSRTEWTQCYSSLKELLRPSLAVSHTVSLYHSLFHHYIFLSRSYLSPSKTTSRSPLLCRRLSKYAASLYTNFALPFSRKYTKAKERILMCGGEDVSYRFHSLPAFAFLSSLSGLRQPAQSVCQYQMLSLNH